MDFIKGDLMDKPQPQQVKRKPAAQDGYKGANDSGIKIILTEKDGTQTILQR